MVFAKKLIGLINHDHHRATQEVTRYGKNGTKNSHSRAKNETFTVKIFKLD